MKYLLLAMAILSFTYSCAVANTVSQAQLDQLEKNFDGKIGVYAIDTRAMIESCV